jgi:translation initiation factor 2B subunit (eIF-2B alpha/beta/delta family)
MNKRLNEIINDRTSGSADLLIKLSKLFSRYIEDINALSVLVEDSDRHFRSFELISKYIKDVKKTLYSGNIYVIKAAVTAPLNNENVYPSIYKNSLPLIKNINLIFTFSNSRTIYEILKLHKKEHPRLKVFITESRPINEGRILAKKLLNKKINVEFAPDVYMSSFIQKCDAVFCGADKLLKDGSIVNKTGSLNAAIISRYYTKPFYIFGESAKLSTSYKKEAHNSDEVWKYDDKKLKIRNSYFEVVPSDLISRVITEL